MTITAVVPAVAGRWLGHAEQHGAGPLESLRVLQVGGARLADELARRVRPVLGARLQQVFGMAEGLLNYTRLDDPDEVICTTQGRPLSPDDEVRIVDGDGNDLPDGASQARCSPAGPTRRAATTGPPSRTPGPSPRTAGTRSGDMCRRTPEGNLVVEGRDKDMINRGGEKISAEEVENLVYRLPGIAQVAAVAAPDPEIGERVCVFVVPGTGSGHHAAGHPGQHGRGRGGRVQVAGAAGAHRRAADDQGRQAGQEGAAGTARHPGAAPAVTTPTGGIS